MAGEKKKSLRNYIAAPLLNGLAFIIAAMVMILLNNIPMAITFVIFGLITSGCMLLYAGLPIKRRFTYEKYFNKSNFIFNANNITAEQSAFRS